MQKRETSDVRRKTAYGYLVYLPSHLSHFTFHSLRQALLPSQSSHPIDE